MTSENSMYESIVGAIYLERNSILVPVPGSNTKEYTLQRAEYWKRGQRGCEPAGPMPAARKKSERELNYYDATKEEVVTRWGDAAPGTVAAGGIVDVAASGHGAPDVVAAALEDEVAEIDVEDAGEGGGEEADDEAGEPGAEHQMVATNS